ncbi:hypothetical protein N7470_001355 [Penicillium chermesinum]|nr:hypothetical protein N7470_001355 [Penicillium chermesinum]
MTTGGVAPFNVYQNFDHPIHPFHCVCGQESNGPVFAIANMGKAFWQPDLYGPVSSLIQRISLVCVGDLAGIAAENSLFNKIDVWVLASWDIHTWKDAFSFLENVEVKIGLVVGAGGRWRSASIDGRSA